jgi:hypothetical protein
MGTRSRVPCLIPTNTKSDVLIPFILLYLWLREIPCKKVYDGYEYVMEL